MYYIEKQIEFDAAHFLMSTGTKCDQLHGHRWVLGVRLKSETLTKYGWVVNFTKLKEWLNEIVSRFDHNVLNLYVRQPTAELLCVDVWRRVHSRLWNYNRLHGLHVDIDSVWLRETPSSLAIYKLSDIDATAIQRLGSSIAGKAAWNDANKRAKITAGLRKANENLELRRGRSERMMRNNPMFKREHVETMMRTMQRTIKKSPNKEERQLIDLIKKHRLPFSFVGDGALIIGGKVPDFVHDSKKLLIEYNGRFWHKNDNPWYRVRDDGEARIKFFLARGYRTLIVWSDEFKASPMKVIDKIRAFERE